MNIIIIIIIIHTMLIFFSEIFLPRSLRKYYEHANAIFSRPKGCRKKKRDYAFKFTYLQIL